MLATRQFIPESPKLRGFLVKLYHLIGAPGPVYCWRRYYNYLQKRSPERQH
ncbi:MAG: hypothetical protein V7642_7132 [Burkholderiales bacterium]|jgi:hypothetical protein